MACCLAWPGWGGRASVATWTAATYQKAQPDLGRASPAAASWLVLALPGFPRLAARSWATGPARLVPLSQTVSWALTPTHLPASAQPARLRPAGLSGSWSFEHLRLSAGSCWPVSPVLREPAHLRPTAHSGSWGRRLAARSWATGLARLVPLSQTVSWALTPTHLPASAQPARLRLTGLSESWSFEHLRLSAGSCLSVSSVLRESVCSRFAVPVSLGLRPHPAVSAYPVPRRPVASCGQASTVPFAPLCHESRPLALTRTHSRTIALPALVS